ARCLSRGEVLVVLAEDLTKLGAHGEDARRLLLSRHGPDFPADLLSPDVEDGLPLVDVLPPQGRRVAEAKARERERRREGIVRRALDLHLLEEPSELRGLEGIRLLALLPGREAHAKGRVARDIENLHRVAEHRPKDAEPAPHRVDAIAFPQPS